MCGIAGYIGSNCSYQEVEKVNLICSYLNHRGPDATQTAHTEQICFGHTRLSIIDLNEHANQPMWNTDRSVLLVLNGEIYNYKKLRTALSKYAYVTHSDTEVILAAYEKWGIDFVHHIEGMFSIALHDLKLKKTFLIRDRFGKKPLYYHKNNQGLWFSSEVRSLIKAQIAPPKLNKNILGYYLQYQTVHYPETIIHEVLLVPPGTIMTITEYGQQEDSYYNNEEAAIKDTVYDKKELRKLFFDSVENRLVSDVPLAVLLSGGIDSNLILAAASKVKKVDAFTIGFKEKEFDESGLAALSANVFGANHHITQLSENDFLDAVQKTLNAMDHPSGDGPNTFVVSEQIRKAGFTVALSGLGGDELFYGYPHYANYDRFYHSILFNAIPKPFLKVFDALKPSNRAKKLLALKQTIKDPSQSMAVFRSNFDEKTLDTVFNLPYTTFKKPPINGNPLDDISRIEMNYYMHDTLLRDADQMSMAHSIELRNPFLDQRLVSYVRGLKNKKSSPAKNLLFDAFNEDLPSEILNKKKSGFTFPWEKWMRGALNTFCKDQMHFLEESNIFKKGSIAQAWKAFEQNSKIYTWSRIWPLVCLSFYIQKNELQY